MSKDRIKEHTDNNVEYITSIDVSCLMHLEGILKRQKSKIRVRHIAEILNSTVKSLHLFSNRLNFNGILFLKSPFSEWACPVSAVLELIFTIEPLLFFSSGITKCAMRK